MNTQAWRSRARSVLVVGIAMVLGVTAGLAVDGFARAQADELRMSQAPRADVPGEVDYPVNENGQTYGSLADAPSEGQAPDLILVELTGGETAYVLAADLAEFEGGDVASPEEAVAWQATREAAIAQHVSTSTASVRSQPRDVEAVELGLALRAYAVDGETEVGVFDPGAYTATP